MNRLSAIVPIAAFALSACGTEKHRPEPQHVSDKHATSVTEAYCTIAQRGTGNDLGIIIHDVETGQDIFSGRGSYPFDSKGEIYNKNIINGGGTFKGELYEATVDKTAGTCVLSRNGDLYAGDDVKSIVYDTIYTYTLK